MLRLVGNLKRLPERLFGTANASKIRRVLYHGPLAGLFITRRLKRLVGGTALVYLCGTALFAWYLVVR